MVVTISPSKASGELQAPPSKSSMQRACAAALLTPGTTVIDHFGNSNDEIAAIEIIRKLGAEIELKGDKMVVSSSDHIFRSPDRKKNLLIDCGESGLSTRMFGPIAGLYHHDITFTGKGSILKRPMDFFDKVLPQLGVEVQSNSGKLPITFHGPMHPKNLEVDGSLSSQFLTGLLFAFAKAATHPMTIKVQNLKSRPYIDLTLAVLDHFLFSVKNRDYESFEILPRKPLPPHTLRYRVEGDWSNAAFLLVAGATAGEVIVTGLDLQSAQGDKRILDALYACGANVKIEGSNITICPGDLHSFEFDATHCPDLFPPLVALATRCKGTTTLLGVHRLLHKESNRAITLRDEFKKMKAEVNFSGDKMTIEGRDLKGTKVSSHNDHRIAMACTVAGLKASGNTIIEDAEAVNKSYPGFYDDLKKLKVNLQIQK